MCVDNSTDVRDVDVESEWFLKEQKEGPKANAKCLKCSNQTNGSRCEECIPGKWVYGLPKIQFPKLLAIMVEEKNAFDFVI